MDRRRSGSPVYERKRRSSTKRSLKRKSSKHTRRSRSHSKKHHRRRHSRSDKYRHSRTEKRKHRSRRSRTRSKSPKRHRKDSSRRKKSYSPNETRSNIGHDELKVNEKKIPDPQKMIKQTELLTGVKIPKYYNTSSMNVMKYAETMQKRKLLWSKKDNQKEINKQVWSATSVVAGRGDDKAAAKFRKLMGIHDDESGNVASTASVNDDTLNNNSALNRKVFEQAELFRRLDADYESARSQTHTSRGVGLGYNNSAFIDPTAFMAGRKD